MSTRTPHWKTLLQASAQHYEAGKTHRREAGRIMWLGAKDAINYWRSTQTVDDPTGMRLYYEVLIALGGTRKGQASKVKSVALATVAHGLDPNAYGSLGAAYEAAYRMGVGSETDLIPVCACPHCPGHTSNTGATVAPTTTEESSR